MKFVRKTMLGAVLAGSMMAAAVPLQGQAVLAVVKRLDDIEARIVRIESGLARLADNGGSQAAPEVMASLAEIRTQLSDLEAEVHSVEGKDAGAEVAGRVDSLSSDVEGLRSALEAVQASIPTEEGANEELAELIAQLRAVLDEARAEAAAVEESPVSFTGRVHTQFNTTSPEGELPSEFMIRRARITAVLKINDWVTGKIQPDFGAGKITLKDAYFKFAVSPHAQVTIGQFKRPFDLFTLTSSTKSLVIETQGKVRGVGDCAGPGGICSYNRFTEKLGFADRDIGVQVSGKLTDPRWAYSVAVTNGEGANKTEVNGAKSYGARLVYSAAKDLKIAGNVSYHDYANGIDSTQTHAPAYGVDVEWGSYSGGWHAQFGYVRGDNWKNLSEVGLPSAFQTAQGILSYRFPIVSTDKVNGIEPVVRLSWADPNSDLEMDHEVFSTAGVVLHFVGRNKLAFNIETWDPSFADREWSFKMQSYLHF